MTKMERSAGLLSSRRFLLLFALATVALYLFGLTVSLLGPDEPRYAQVAREMFERGDWVTPTLGGFHWFEKPALLYWLQISSYNLFGVNEFAARFGSALFGLGTIFSLWMLGRIGMQNNGRDASYPGYLLIIAASTLGLIVFSRGASFDIILTFPITASLVGFFAYDQGRDSRTRYVGLAAFYFFMGLAVLAKGLIGFVFPFAIVGLYHLFRRQMPKPSLIISLFWGSLLAVAVAATWYLPMYLRHGWEFIDEFFVQHHFQRYTSNKYLHPQPFHFFFWVLPLMTIPWIPFFFISAWRSIRRAYPLTPAASVDPLSAFVWAWMLVPLFFFSFSGSKLPGYILPAVPAAIVIASFSTYRFAQKRPRNSAIVKGLAVATFVVIAAIIVFALPRFADADSVERLIRVADEKGYASTPVAGFLTISHNAEFYAAGRVLRNADGTQRRLAGNAEVPPTIAEAGGGAILLLVRPEQRHHLENDPMLNTELIAENGEMEIVAVSLR